MLTAEQVAQLGGTVREGAEGVLFRERERVEGEGGALRYTGRRVSVRVWPASDCVGLDQNRFKGRPARVHPELAESMAMFMAATKDVGLDSLGEAADWCFSQRYGLAPADEPLPTATSGEDVDATIARCYEISRELGGVCWRVDRNIKLYKHPEWATEAERAVANEPDEVSAIAHTVSVVGQYSSITDSPAAKEASRQARLKAEELIAQANGATSGPKGPRVKVGRAASHVRGASAIIEQATARPGAAGDAGRHR